MEKQGHQTEYVYLYDLNFKGCGNCEYTSPEEGYCTKKDDLNPVIQKMLEADLVVFSAPIYLDYICGTAKTFLDRFCGFVNPDFSINRLPGKKFVLLTSQGDPNPLAYKHVMDSISGLLTNFFKCEVVGTFIANPGMQDVKIRLAELAVPVQELALEVAKKLK